MPLDPSIILGARMPEIANPLAMAQQAQSLQLQRQQAAALEEQRQASAEYRRAQTDQLQRAQQEADALNQLPVDEQGNVSPAALYKIVGPERGAKILKLGFDLRKQRYETEAEGRAGALASLAGVEALPEQLRAPTWQVRIAKWGKIGYDVSELPPEYSPEALANAKHGLLTPDKRYDVEHPKPTQIGKALVQEQPDGSFKSVYTEPETTKPVYRVGADKRTLEPIGDLPANAQLVQEAQPPRVTVNAGGSKSALDDDGVEYAATLFRLTNQMPSLGMGGKEEKAAIINGAAKQAKALGQTPAASIQRTALYKADADSLKKITLLGSTAQAAESKAIGQAGIVAELSQKVDRTRWPLVNAAIMAGKTEIAGDKDATLLLNAITTFASEYGKIVEGSTGSVAGSSESARAAATRLITAKMSKGTLQGALDLMQREMALTIQGYDVTRTEITKRMGGTPQSLTTTPPPPADPLKVTAPNGKTYTFTTKAQADAFRAKAGIQ